MRILRLFESLTLSIALCGHVHIRNGTLPCSWVGTLACSCAAVTLHSNVYGKPCTLDGPSSHVDTAYPQKELPSKSTNSPATARRLEAKGPNAIESNR